MFTWTRALAIPDYRPDSPLGEPDTYHRADTPDGTLWAIQWGNGGRQAPFTLAVLFQPTETEGADQPQDSRYPTLEELISAADTLLPEGVLLGQAPLITTDPDNRPALRGLCGHQLTQVGAVPGSAAHALNPITLARPTDA